MTTESAEREEIERLLRGLGRKGRDPAIARVVRALLAGKEVAAPGRASIVDELCRPHANRWRQSALCYWAITRFPIAEEARGEVIEHAIRFADRNQDDVRLGCSIDAVGRVGFYVGIAVAVIGGLLSIGSLNVGLGGMVIALIGNCVLTAVTWCAVFLAGLPAVPFISNHYKSRARVPRRFAMFTLGFWSAHSGIGPLARELRRSADPEDRRMALQALSRTLPSLSLDLYGSFSAADQADLGRLLHVDFVPQNLKLAILKALSKIGGAPALPAVMAAAELGEDVIVAGAARVILPSLELRAEREWDAGRLVRPSSAPAEDSSRLVRPVESSALSDPALLLHPAESQSVRSHNSL